MTAMGTWALLKEKKEEGKMKKKEKGMTNIRP